MKRMKNEWINRWMEMDEYVCERKHKMREKKDRNREKERERKNAKL